MAIDNAGSPKPMPLIAYGESFKDGFKSTRALSAMQLSPGQYLVHVSDMISSYPPVGLAGAPMPPQTMTVVVQAGSLDELRAMFFEQDSKD